MRSKFKKNAKPLHGLAHKHHTHTHKTAQVQKAYTAPTFTGLKYNLYMHHITIMCVCTNKNIQKCGKIYSK